MTEEVRQPDPLDNEVLNFSFTVAQTNYILGILGESSYVKSAPAIGWINMQGEPQFKELLEREKAKNESKTTAEKSGNQ